MYHSAGNYEAFAHPQKPEGVDKKSAYVIGTGLAGLTAAFYLVRDGQMKGEHVHVLEKLPIPGGSTDGIHDPSKGFIMRGGREMDNHFEVMWDVFRDVPSRDNPNVSVLDDYYWLNKKDPNYSLCRATHSIGAKTPIPIGSSPWTLKPKRIDQALSHSRKPTRGYEDRSDLR
jgi:oleate hydratase